MVPGTLQFVRREPLGWHRSVPGGGPLKRTPGPVDALPLVPCRTEPVLKIRAVGLIVVNGKWSCDYTDQGMAARHRALDRGYRGSCPPQPRDQSLHSSYKRRYFQYADAVRRSIVIINLPNGPAGPEHPPGVRNTEHPPGGWINALDG